MPGMLVPRPCGAQPSNPNGPDLKNQCQVVLKAATPGGTKAEEWLVQTIKRCITSKRPLNKVPQAESALKELLSKDDAYWSMASMMLKKAPNKDLCEDENPLVNAIHNYELIHIEGRVTVVDGYSGDQHVLLRLTEDTIDQLIEYHKDIYMVNIMAREEDWADKQKQADALHAKFADDIKKWIYKTSFRALEGMEEDGAGELLAGRSEEVKSAIKNLMRKSKDGLKPPPPKILDHRQPTLLPSSPSIWSVSSQHSPNMHAPIPIPPWQQVPSNAPVSSATAHSPTIWANTSIPDMQSHSSPIPYQSYTPEMLYSSAMSAAPLPVLSTMAPALPSTLFPSQCGVGMGAGMGYSTFNTWGRPHEFTMTM